MFPPLNWALFYCLLLNVKLSKQASKHTNLILSLLGLFVAQRTRIFFSIQTPVGSELR